MRLPGYTIPNVYGDIYCVFTNRTPATPCGFGVGVDFALECQMDKLAHRRHRGSSDPQRLSRRRHEGTPARAKTHADRMRRSPPKAKWRCAK
jgi:hypothetical protein